MKTLSSKITTAKKLLAVSALLALFFALTVFAQAQSSALGKQFPLYVSSYGDNSIYKLDSNGNQTLFTSGNYIDGPWGLAFDASGVLYVTSYNNNAIVKVDSTGAQSIFTSGEYLDHPVDLAFDGSGNLWVASANLTGPNLSGSIVKVDSTGSQTLIAPSPFFGLAFDGVGILYLGFGPYNTIIKADITNNTSALVTQNGYLDFTWGLAFDSGGALYVASLGNRAIVKVDSSGVQNVFTSGGNLGVPFDLAFDGSGKLYVADSASNAIVRVDSTGAQTVFASGGNLAGPAGLAFSRGYNFSGFLQPVDNLPTVNVAKAGTAIPVKFSLGGNQGLSIFAPGFPASQQITCNISAPVSDVEDTIAAGASSLTYDPTTDQYSYIWKTNTAWKNTCRKLTVKLNDGSMHVANFQFK